MRFFRIFFSLAAVGLFLGLSGCDKPDPNPHLSDFIYQDIQVKLSKAMGDESAAAASVQDLEKQLGDADKLSSEPKKLRAKLRAAKSSLERSKQMVLYFKMRQLSRENYVREQYLNAYKAGKKWDNSEEIKAYKKSEFTASPSQPPAQEGGGH